MQKRALGKIGEKYAEDFLKSADYEILKNNYFCRLGEIDLIAKDPVTRQLVFIEVKARTSTIYGTPEDSLTPLKQHKILKSIFHYLENFPHYCSWRIDLIALKLTPQGGLISLNHLKNILDG